MDQFLFLFLSSFSHCLSRNLYDNLHVPLLSALSALPSDMAAFHQQYRGEELKGVCLSENTDDVISDHDHWSQADPKVRNQELDSWTSSHLTDHLSKLSELDSCEF